MLGGYGGYGGYPGGYGGKFKVHWNLWKFCEIIINKYKLIIKPKCAKNVIWLT